MTITNAFDFVDKNMKALCASQLADLPAGVDMGHKADGDLNAFALMLTWENGLDVVMIHNSYFENTTTKDNLIVMLRQHIRRNRAQAIALMSPCWMLQRAVSKEEAAQMERGDLARPDGLPDNLGDHPEAMEFLALWVCSQFRREVYCASVHRTETAPPTLGEWTQSTKTVDRFSVDLQQSIIAVS